MNLWKQLNWRRAVISVSTTQAQKFPQFGEKNKISKLKQLPSPQIQNQRHSSKLKKYIRLPRNILAKYLFDCNNWEMLACVSFFLLLDRQAFGRRKSSPKPPSFLPIFYSAHTHNARPYIASSVKKLRFCDSCSVARRRKLPIVKLPSL